MMKLTGNPPLTTVRVASRGAAGFSLVEVTLALGILAFAFVALLGMLPVGLQTAGEAIDATVQSQIRQAITTRARQAKFTELASLNRNPDADPDEPTPDFFFDYQGNEIVTGPSGTPPDEYIYGAAVVLTESAAGVSTELPGEGAGRVQNSHLATLKVVVRKVSAPKQAHVFNLYVANNGL